MVRSFVVQWGMHGDPEVMKKWIDATIADDPVVETNGRGTVTFAKTNSPNSRSTQVFINLRDNPRLDGMGFAPIGKVVEGMETVEAINSEYGEGPQQGKIYERGNEYLTKMYPNLTYIQKAQVAD